jgi:multidrug efflux pump subunit AcrA (membrane-fusion protein)
LPQAGIFLVLAAIGWWGHSTHWSIPKPSSLWSANAGAQPVTQPESVKRVPTAGEFPNLAFATIDDVKRADIATIEVARKDLEETATANAVVGYDRGHVAQLAPRKAGRVAYVFKRLGDSVTKGEVLALLDTEDVGSAKAEFLQEAGLALYKTQVHARLAALGTDVLAQNTIRDAEDAIREAKLRRFAAHQKLLNLGISADLPEEMPLTPDEMARRLQFAGIPDEIVAKLNPQPRTANLIPLISPLSGVVTQMDTVVGEMERPDQPAITVADVSRMWVWLSVRKEDVGRLALGQLVDFQFDGRDSGCTGRLAWISTEIDQKTRTVQARVDVENPYHRPPSEYEMADEEEAESKPRNESPRELKANMFGAGRVRVARIEDAILVPDVAVQTLEVAPKSIRKLVFLAHPDGVTFEPRSVRLGRSRNGMTHIVEGLKSGDRIVTTGSYILKSELMLEDLDGDEN